RSEMNEQSNFIGRSTCLSSEAQKISHSSVGDLSNAIFTHLNDSMAFAVKLEINIRDDFPIDLHSSLRDESARFASGLCELQHIGQQLTNPNGFWCRELFFYVAR